MTPDGRYILAVLAASLVSSAAAPVCAQVRWDVGVLAGATARVTTGDRAVPHPAPGPSGELHAHVAVLPMLRIGPYAAFDLSPATGTQARQIYAAGLRAKVTPPVLTAPWRAWVYAGFGFADAYTPAYTSPGSAPGREAASIGMLELPIGIGVGHKLRGRWDLGAELGVRFVAAKGPIHTPAEGGVGPTPPLVRDDLLAVSLSVGVSFGP